MKQFPNRSIELDDQEREIINSTHFQRLRRIKQLSLTDMVYPSAAHTRFEHSLGVMQMASDIFDSTIRKKGNLRKLGLNEENRSRVRKTVRLAALLHDVGHSPFSHAGEDIMPRLPESHLDFEHESRKIQKYDHAHYSKMAIRVFFKDVIDNYDDADGIKTDEVLFLLGDKSAKPSKSLTPHKDLISGNVDVDRADYLLRDSYHLGVRYGHYDKNRLVKCATVGEENDAPVLAIEYGGWQVAESIIMARYNMFTSVYFHKTRRIYDHHIGEALKEVLKSHGFNDGTFPPPSENAAELEKYFDFDDWKVYGALKEGRGGEHGSYILDRKHYKQKGKDWIGVLKPEEEQEIESLKEKYKNHFLDEKVTTSGYKMLDKKTGLDKEVRILLKDGRTVFLSEISDIVKQIRLPEITRFYAE